MRELRSHPAAFHLSKHDVATASNLRLWGCMSNFCRAWTLTKPGSGWEELNRPRSCEHCCFRPDKCVNIAIVARRHYWWPRAAASFHLTFSNLDTVVDALLGKAL